jgi:hypothetical protein
LFIFLWSEHHKFGIFLLFKHLQFGTSCKTKTIFVTKFNTLVYRISCFYLFTGSSGGQQSYYQDGPRSISTPTTAGEIQEECLMRNRKDNKGTKRIWQESFGSWKLLFNQKSYCNRKSNSSSPIRARGYNNAPDLKILWIMFLFKNHHKNCVGQLGKKF